MIISTATLYAGQVLTADICLIGSGPAAISLALSFADSPYSVLVLAGGSWTETSANQALSRGSVWPAGSHEPLEEHRRRQFGGTSAAWGGRCMPFEPLDFQPRAWVPASGWPVSYAELLPHYRRAAELCQLGRFEFDARKAFPDSPAEIIPGLDSDSLISSPLERWSPPVHFGKTYRAALARSPNLRVLLEAQVLSLQLADDTDAVGHAEVDVLGVRLQVQAQYFVVAAGGIENARLLLASTHARFPTGLGNQHDNVGRYYMVHLSGTYANVTMREPRQVWAGFERDRDGVYCRRRWWFPEPTQAANQLLNTIFFLYHPSAQEGSDPGVLFSSRFLAKAVSSILTQRSPGKMVRHTQQQLPAVWQHAGHLAKNGVREVPYLLKSGVQRLAKRRLPFLLPSKRTTRWGLYFQAEQTPNRESRVQLSATETDRFGRPQAEVQLAFVAADIESLVRAHALFVARFKAVNPGHITYDEAELRHYLHQRVAAYNSGSHHIGTTRMAVDPQKGVVDANAQVHGVHNLFVAGASTFPTGGHANPTLTIVAQALRLADYLKQRLTHPEK